MALTSLVKTDKALLMVAAGILVLMAACYPLAHELDERTDRTRPMYDDRAAMEWLQYRSVVSTGRAVPLEVSDGESYRIDGETFAPSDGVTVVVRTPEPDSYCVQVSNQHGDVSRWACLDEQDPPSDPEAPQDPAP